MIEFGTEEWRTTGLLREGSLAGQAAVVTGGAGGIGRCTAVELARAGAHVTVADVGDPAETVAIIKSFGGRAAGVTLDVSDRDACKRVIGAIGALDIVVTSAGIYGEPCSIDDLTVEELDRVMGVNFHGTVWTIRAALPALRASGHGRIVCVSSAAGKMGGTRSGLQYVGSKGAINAFVKWLARKEADHGILVNGLAPGATDTGMIAGRDYKGDTSPLKRVGQPEEAARAAAFLCSPLMGYVTGTILDVNGGMYMA